MNSIGLHHISLVRRIVVRMSSTSYSYEDAIYKLNSLQSNKSTIEQIKNGLKTGQKCTNIEDMENYLKRIGIPLSRLDELSVIHVAGTKGKGSTSAMCESILRHHGFRTGFYSSPHLVEARERIRLDGRPLTREQFATHLHHVYKMLWDSQAYEGDMPKYFAFLTVMAFHVFLQKRVHVAVVEVGIGGIVDFTNVLRKVPVVGITALGLDHTSILGHTLPEIAAAKAGVMKRGCDAYTVRQPDDAQHTLQTHADQVKCPLTIVPDFSSYKFPGAENSHLPVDLEAYKTNASLAIQLSHAWMRTTQAKTSSHCVSNHGNKELNGSANEITNGLQNGSKKDQNGLTNGYVKYGVNDITNGTLSAGSKIQNNLTNINLLNNSSQDDCNVNGLQNNISNGLKNGTNKVQNGTTNGNVLNSFNGISNGTKDECHKIQNGLTNYSNCGNNLNGFKVQNGVTNGNIQANLVYKVPYETALGLRQCKWPGRYQVIEAGYAKFYLDGAHTKESMEICAQWFIDNCSSADKTLIFSATGDRNAATLLLPLRNIPFKRIYFVIPTAYKLTTSNHDNYSLVEQEELVQRCRNHAQIWLKNNNTTDVTVLESVSEALKIIAMRKDNPSVLITGSLHLVGAALSILDPSLSA